MNMAGERVKLVALLDKAKMELDESIATLHAASVRMTAMRSHIVDALAAMEHAEPFGTSGDAVAGSKREESEHDIGHGGADAEARIYVRDVATLERMLQDLKKHSTIAVDMEGVELGRPDGSAVLLQLATSAKTFVVDLYLLKKQGVDAVTHQHRKQSLKKLLSNPAQTKLFWDVRGDAIALRKLGVELKGALDLQVADFAMRKPRSNRVAGLAQALKAVGVHEGDKAATHAAFDKWRDSGKVFLSHPLIKDRDPDDGTLQRLWRDYAANDVVHLPMLWRNFQDQLSKSMLKKVKRHSGKRVDKQQLATSALFEGW